MENRINITSSGIFFHFANKALRFLQIKRLYYTLLFFFSCRSVAKCHSSSTCTWWVATTFGCCVKAFTCTLWLWWLFLLRSSTWCGITFLAGVCDFSLCIFMSVQPLPPSNSCTFASLSCSFEWQWHTPILCQQCFNKLRNINVGSCVYLCWERDYAFLESGSDSSFV